jgi:hypothetical protein
MASVSIDSMSTTDSITVLVVFAIALAIIVVQLYRAFK